MGADIGGSDDKHQAQGQVRQSDIFEPLTS